jgi:hypothetical protein
MQIAVPHHEIVGRVSDVDAIPKSGAVDVPTLNNPWIGLRAIPARNAVRGREVSIIVDSYWQV